MMVVVQPLTARQQRQESQIGGRVVEVPIAHVVAQTVDGGGEHEDVDDRVNAGCEQAPPESKDRA